MNILLLEDSGEIYYNLFNYLTDKEHKVFHAYQISDAIGIFESKKSEIDLIIADLNVPPTGLKKEEVDRSMLGKLSAWIWLEEYVLHEDNDYWRGRIIIYSAFIEVLRDNVEDEKLNGIGIIAKSSDKSFSELFDKQIERYNKH